MPHSSSPFAASLTSRLEAWTKRIAEQPLDLERLREVAERPEVSVVIPIFNAAAALERCLQSIRDAHDYGPECEIVLVDDHSGPEIAELSKRFARERGRVKILRNDRNLGFVGTVNRGMQNASAGNDIVLLNSDTVVTRGWLRALGVTAYLDPRIATVCPVSNAAGVFSIPVAYEDGPLPEGYTLEECQRALSLVAAQHDEQVPTTSGFCMWIKRSVIEKVGYFDDLLFLRGYGEENDFNERARGAGFVHVVDDGRLVYHERGLSFGADKQQLKKQNSRILKALHRAHVDDTKAWLATSRLDDTRRPYAALLDSLREASPTERARLLASRPIVSLVSARVAGTRGRDENDGRIVAWRAMDRTWSVDVYGLASCWLPDLPDETVAFLLARRFDADRIETVGIAQGDRKRVAMAAAAIRIPYRALDHDEPDESRRSGNSREERSEEVAWTLPSTILAHATTDVDASPRAARPIDIIAESGLFDPIYYLNTYPEVRTARRGPLAQYVKRGVRQKRKPNALFDPEFYAAEASIAPTDQPLVHYILEGEGRGLEPHPSFNPTEYAKRHPELRDSDRTLLAHCLKSMAERCEEPSPRPGPPDLDGLAITVAIAVFNGGARLRRCVESVIEETSLSNVELLLIDDASTDRATTTILGEYVGTPSITVLRNETRLGLAKTMNRAFDHAAGRDVVLLSASTLVGPHWLEHLALAVYGQGRAASATALSDDAGAFGTPLPGNNATHESLPVSVATRMSRRAADSPSHRVPAGNLFCMYIRREALTEVGPFDTGKLARDYGEADDWCMRAVDHGWQHVIALRTYVHQSSATSRDPKNTGSRAALGAIGNRHPDRGFLMNEAFHGESPLSRQRARFGDALRASARPPRPRVLYVITSRTGSTPTSNEGLVRGIRSLYEAYVLHCDAAQMTWSRVEDGSHTVHALSEPVPMLPHSSTEYDAVVADWLIEHDIELVHVRHIALHSLGLVRTAKQLGIPVVFSFDDFYTVCPSVNLTDGTEPYRPHGISSPHVVAPLWSKRDPKGLAAAQAMDGEHVLATWRRRMGAMLALCDGFVTTSENAKAILVDNFPFLNQSAGGIRVVPHGRNFGTFRAPSAARSQGKLRVLLPGTISASRGLALVSSLLELDTKGSIEIHLLGPGHDQIRALPGVIDHGRYQRDELIARATEIDPHVALVPSMWPETFNHTLTECWAAGVPVVGSAVGVVGERIAQTGAGWTFDPHNPSALLALLRGIASSPAQWTERARAVERWQKESAPTETVSATATRYLELYAAARRRRRRFSEPSTRRPRVAVVARRHYPDASASVYIRIAGPIAHASGAVEYRWMSAPDLLRAGLDQFDGVLVCRNGATSDQLVTLRQAAQRANTNVVVDLDDNLFAIPEDKDPLRRYESSSHALRALLNAASTVTVSTAPLVDALQNIGPDIRHVPNRLDPRLWFDGEVADPDVSPALRTPGEVRIVYMGSPTHDEDFALIRPAFERLRAKYPVRLFLIGVTRDDETPEGVERLTPPDGRYDRFAAWFRSVSSCFHIAVAPLVDTPFNGCKSDLKFLEYGACGLPVIASDVTPYRETVHHEEDGLLVSNDVDAWTHALTRLIRDEALRERLGGAARARIARDLVVRECVFDALPWGSPSDPGSDRKVRALPTAPAYGPLDLGGTVAATEQDPLRDPLDEIAPVSVLVSDEVAAAPPVPAAPIDVEMTEAAAAREGALKRLKKSQVKRADAGYFYTLWLMHLSLLHESGMTEFPLHVAEVGPGYDVGLGLCALLSGCTRYTALDLVAHADLATSERVLDELLQMFRERAPRPKKVFPDFDHCLDANLFPSHILTNDRLDAALQPDRVQRIREALHGTSHPDATFEYLVPWMRSWDRHYHSVDVIMSQSVMEHVDDLPTAYLVFGHLLRPGGFMSHHVDFKSHGITPEWNGHWTMEAAEWSALERGQHYLLNREPASRHFELVRKFGFRVLREDRILKAEHAGAPQEALLPRWRDLSHEDRTTSGLFLQAQIPPEGSAA